MKYKLLRCARYTLQILSLATFVFLFTYLVYPMGWQASVLEWFSYLDPWMLLGQLHFTHTVPAWAWLSVLTLLATLLLGRIFCGWLCPFGAFMTLADMLGRLICKHKALKKWAEFQREVMKKLLRIRYLWLFFLLILFILGLNFASSLTPFALFSHEIVRIFTGAVPWGLIAIFAGTVVFGRLWCAVFCPTGVLLSLLSKLRLFRYRTGNNCVRCNKCAKHCPVGAAPNEKEMVGEGCLVCGECVSVCPTKTVGLRIKRSLPDTENEESKIKVQENNGKQNQLTRRQFLKIAGVFIVGIAVSILGKVSWMYKKILRPPGALSESEFKAVCNRCGRCIKVCPNNALKPMPLSDGIDAFETPYIIARQANCCLCMSCQEVCPTGAIARVPVENVKMGTAVIDTSRCLAWSQGKDCFICGEQCLRVAIDTCRQCPNRCTGSRKPKEVSFGPGTKYVPVRMYGNTKCKLNPIPDNIPINPFNHTLDRKDYMPSKAVILRIKEDIHKVKERMCLSEHPFGTVKWYHGAHYLLCKGKEKATAELGLSFLAYNLKRAINMLGVPKLIAAL